MGRDYKTEILVLLKDKPMNGITLQRNLHLTSKQIDEELLYSMLKSLQYAGKIEWVETSVTDGVWKVKEGG